jgi:hypothetical protein
MVARWMVGRKAYAARGEAVSVSTGGVPGANMGFPSPFRPCHTPTPSLSALWDWHTYSPLLFGVLTVGLGGRGGAVRH